MSQAPSGFSGMNIQQIRRNELTGNPACGRLGGAMDGEKELCDE
jgi:hypothetical protein